MARHGGPVWIHKSLPKYKRTSKAPPSGSSKFLLYLEKFKDIIRKGYIVAGKEVQSYMDVFHVEKTKFDIRMIYNGTSCGLNNSVWAPNFWLPTARSAARVLSYYYCTMDKDLG